MVLKQELHQVREINSTIDLSNRKLIEANTLLQKENLLLHNKINTIEDNIYKIERKSKAKSCSCVEANTVRPINLRVKQI